MPGTYWNFISGCKRVKTEQNPSKGDWSFWIDRGGTFTDVIGRRPDGKIITHKLLSENPQQYADATLQGIRDLMGWEDAEPIPSQHIREVKMGTTVGTNALLERKGEPVMLVTTKGFRDALRIGYQNRPSLFDLHITLPEMLYQTVLEVDERVDANGGVLVPLDEEAAENGLRRAYEQGIRAVAILFMHGYRFPEHEAKVAGIARKIGFQQVSASHEVSPLVKFVSRGDTTVVDAYLSPVLKRYVDGIAGELQNCRLQFMKSNGGLTDARLFAGKDSILSGPAGGVVGAVRTAEEAGFDRIIGFDMGGTSTDVSHFCGEFERTYETEIAGVRMRAPMMRIHTVAAGGGSILHFDGSRYRVGPDSAGADPGPACYRRGGPLTVTDCNLLVGKILPEFFPHIFGPDADQPLDRKGVASQFKSLAQQIEKSTGDNRSAEQVADGFLAIAVENMANAIKKISVQRGYDVTEYTLACFGGAGGQHACLVADALGIKRVLIHPYAGVLSAYGMGLADLNAMAEQAIEKELTEGALPVLDEECEKLVQQTTGEILNQGVGAHLITVQKKAQIRYKDSDTCLLVGYGLVEEMTREFEQMHRRQFGFLDRQKPLVVEALVVEAVGKGEAVAASVDDVGLQADLAPEAVLTHTKFFSMDKWREGPVVKREAMTPGNKVEGPAIIVEHHTTIVVEPGWQAEITARHDILLTRTRPKARKKAIGTDADPVMLEIFNNLYMSIAEQMGTVLAKTAHSVNIKERLDFSCAIFDRLGNLVANAPHVPVHLGSMGESVKAVLEARSGTIVAGDVFAVNAPYNGGTHLPDITVITPVFDRTGQEVLFFVASRGHHADIGGITPGSMPPASETVEEEGVLFDNFKLVDKGEFRESALMALLASGRYPARNPEQNKADLKAQLAANEKGVQELLEMVDYYGLPVVTAYMQHVQDNAEEAVRRVIDVLNDSKYVYQMDNGARIVVNITVDRGTRTARLDFTGTSSQLESNFNAPLAVCKAAVLYVFRCLVNDNIPLNAGCLKPLEIVVPEGSFLNPRYQAAVVAGNVETSQCIADALFGALGAVAGSQGTMNNFTFGNERWQYYETIAGGAGAGPSFNGASAVHTHMTNSRLTDPEILEWRFPVLLESFGIRQGSGGAGHYRGGDGVVRRVRFLKDMTASILSNNRSKSPPGMAGGDPGRPGLNMVERADGKRIVLGSADQEEMHQGDVFVIETPGGGGYGSKE